MPRRMLWFFVLLLVSGLTRVGAQSPDTEVLPLVISTNQSGHEGRRSVSQPSGSLTFSTTVSGVNTSNVAATVKIDVFDSLGSFRYRGSLVIQSDSPIAAGGVDVFFPEGKFTSGVMTAPE